MAVAESRFDSRALASAAAAQNIVAALARELDAAGDATVIVSGGTTPESCFRLLADTDLDWERVHVVPSDERCVPVEHDASNEGMLRRVLLTGRAAGASLVPLYDDALDAADQCAAFETRWARVRRPAAICLLGMGEDGHFASLFPDSSQLDQALDPAGAAHCMLVRTRASSYPRMTLTMRALLESREILLLIFGDRKQKVFVRANTSADDLPVSRLLRQQQTGVRVFWAP